MKEREISLIDLIFEIILKWRMIIVFMVIGGILLGGYSYLQSAKNIEVQKNQSQNVLSDTEILVGLEEKLTVEEKTHVKAALGYASYDEYYNASLLMQIDGNNTPTTELIFRVTAPDARTEDALVRVYEQLFDTGISAWLVQEGMDVTDAAKINELIITENEEITQLVQSFMEKNGSVYVRVVHVNEDKCKELARQVIEYVFAQKKNLEKVYGTHEVALVNETFATVINEELLSNQRTVVINIYNSMTYVDKLKNAFSSEQKQYYDLLKKGVSIVATDDNVSAPMPAPVAVDLSPSVSVKYVLLGMILFAFLYVFYVFMIYIFNNKLRASDNLAELYPMVQLGTISTRDGKKKFLGFVDGWILSIRNRNKRKFTLEEATEISAVAIKMAVKKVDGKEVCFVGCDIKKNTQDVCNDITSILEKEDIKVTVLDNFLYNAEELEKLSDAKCAVLIEKTGSTMYEEVAKELELLERNNINVLGGILVD